VPPLAIGTTELRAVGLTPEVTLPEVSKLLAKFARLIA